jgi:hypothetical protein
MDPIRLPQVPYGPRFDSEAGIIDRAAHIVICPYCVRAARHVQIRDGARSGPDDALPCDSFSPVRLSGFV